jgi:hypothetical protein
VNVDGKRWRPRCSAYIGRHPHTIKLAHASEHKRSHVGKSRILGGDRKREYYK